MAKLIFRLRDVEVDEIVEVKQLLEEHELDVYETSGGLFGLSVAGLWLVDDSRYQEARDVLDEYAKSRALEWQSVTAPSILQQWLHKPLQTLLLLFSIAVIAFFSLWPFLYWGE